jgi:CHAD domain-containing protein
MARSTAHLVPDTLPQTELLARLQSELSGKPAPAAVRNESYYDTFDCRLHRAGLRLVRTDATYRLEPRPGAPSGRRLSQRVERRPRFWWEFPAGPLQKALRSHLKVRALVHLATLRRRGRRLLILNQDEKTVARGALEEVALLNKSRRQPLGRVLLLEPLRGYDADLDRCTAVIQAWGLVPQEDGILPLAMQAQGLELAGYSSKLDISLEPGLPSGAAVQRILAHLLWVMQQNQPGIKADIDTEFLHDFRVAVRRTRAALGQLKEVLAPETGRLWRERFGELGRRTNRLRDLDVYLLRREEYRALLPASLYPGLEALFRELVRERTAEHTDFVAYLGSEAHAELLATWGIFLRDDPSLADAAAPAAQEPVLELAQRRITRRYHRLLEIGQAIDSKSPERALHRLRIQGKNLRYLLEFFASLFPSAEHEHLIAQLKRLQDNLGEFNDLHVQQVFLEGQLAEVRHLRPAAAAAAAIGGLLVHLRARQTAVRSEFAATFRRFAAEGNARIFAVNYAPVRAQGAEG